jgi:antibiotic biosynthesis monooxygenase (ABM) superfamily enzyme
MIKPNRIRLRSDSSRFIGALLAWVLYLLFVLATGGLGDAQGTTSLITLIIMLVVVGLFGAWALPWVQRRFSAHQMRKQKKLQVITGRPRRSGHR